MINRQFPLLFAFLVMVMSCSRQDLTQPEIIRIGMSPGQEEAEKRAKTMVPFKEYLIGEIGKKVDLKITDGYGTLIVGLRYDKIDIAHLGPFGYIIAKEKADAEILLARGSEDKGPYQYSSYYITYKGSGLNSFDDVLKNRKNITLIFNDPASTSGHLIPRAHLLRLGIDPEKEFKQVIFSNSHSATVYAVKAQKAEIAAVSSSTFKRMISKEMIKSEDFVILWESQPIVSSVVAVRKNLSPELKMRIKNAYKDCKYKDTAAWNAITDEWPDTAGITYVDASDSMYDSLRVLARHIDLLKVSE